MAPGPTWGRLVHDEKGITIGMLGDSELRALGRPNGVTSEGGVIAEGWLVTYTDGTRVAGKTLAGAPSGYSRPRPKAWLAALRANGNRPPNSGGPR